MNTEPHFPVEPWAVREPQLDLDRLGAVESIFTVSNGNLGLRGNLDEGEPRDSPGTHLSGFYEKHPVSYPEGGYGLPQWGQTILKVTSGKRMRLVVEDEPFDVRAGTLVRHERTLDLRAGTLHREVEWVSTGGAGVRIRSTRLASFDNRAVAAIRYEVEPVDRTIRIVLQSQLAANEVPAEVENADPRVGASLENPLISREHLVTETGAVLVHTTASSGLTVAAGAHHEVSGPPGAVTEHQLFSSDLASTTVRTQLRPGERLLVVKYLAYDWSPAGGRAGLRNRVLATLTDVGNDGWDSLAARQRRFLDDWWAHADVELDGDPVAQQAVRFALFQVLQATARADGQPVGGKGLTGLGYNGHTFWDVDGFVVPLLAVTMPQAAANILAWRAATLPKARQRATILQLQGAVFPWRTVDGEETSGYWPASAAALHLNAVVSRAVEVHRLATGDAAVERDSGLPVLVETARMWASAGRYDDEGRWHLDGVTGPDEFTAVVDDNVFTNLLAAWNLRSAAASCQRHPDVAAGLRVAPAEITAWSAMAAAVHVPYDERLGVHQQCAGFTRQQEWDFAACSPEPLMSQASYFQLYRHQVVKQADLVLAMHWCPDAFSTDDKARNVDYYEPRTVRDSSLSAASQAVLCAELGHLELAHDYLHETALVDLLDLHGSTAEGVHLAAAAGAWAAAVEGFGGLRLVDDTPRLAPALPRGLQGLRFRLSWRGVRLLVDVTRDTVTCSLPGQPGARLGVRLYGEEVTVAADRPVTVPLQAPTPLLPEPTQPPGHGLLVRGRAAAQAGSGIGGQA